MEKPRTLEGTEDEPKDVLAMVAALSAGQPSLELNFFAWTKLLFRSLRRTLDIHQINPNAEDPVFEIAVDSAEHEDPRSLEPITQSQGFMPLSAEKNSQTS